MKMITYVLAMIALMAAPAHADEFFLWKLFGSQNAQLHRSADGHQRAHHERGRSRHVAASYAMPSGARAFIANASYYGGGPRRLEPNTHTASGERFNQWGLTCAHRTLPIGTRLLVSHGGRSVVVRVNDRGPAAWTGRSIDLSRGAATRIGLISSGTGAVHVQVLGGS